LVNQALEHKIIANEKNEARDEAQQEKA